MNFTKRELEVFLEETSIDLLSDFWFNRDGDFNHNKWVRYMRHCHNKEVKTVEQALAETKKVSEELFTVIKKAIDVKSN